MVLLDAISHVEAFVGVFIGVYVLLIFAYVLTSWIKLPSALSPVQRFLNDVCEPYLRLFRRLVPMAGPLDLSPIVGVFALIFFGKLVNFLLELLH